MKTALVLMNLGSPKSTSVSDVRTYLQEFLMDENVIDYSYFIRFPLVYGIISPFRAKKSAAAYRTIWTPQGSPLVVLSEQLRQALEKTSGIPTYLCMRYAGPTPYEIFQKLQAEHPDVTHVKLLPLYPQHTMSSYGTAIDYAYAQYQKGNFGFQLSFVNPFFAHPQYIQSLANSIAPYLQEKDFDKILFSYHGIPARHLRKDQAKIEQKQQRNQTRISFPSLNYQQQCLQTTDLVAKALQLAPEAYTTSFQSRLSSAGKKWLFPYTAATLQQLPQQGVKKLLVVCPAFISDCLETLEEIAQEGKHLFLEAGGETFTYIPCLNTQEDWVATLSNWAKENKWP